jgi:DNA-binding NtrC family response regulator
MAERSLHRCRILVVEDEYLLADELALELEDEGAVVLGPVSNVQHALALLDSEATPDGAILDVNLGGELAFPIADALIGRGVPLIFTSGYDPAVFPDRYSHVPKCEKPFDMNRIAAVLSQVIHA